MKNKGRKIRDKGLRFKFKNKRYEKVAEVQVSKKKIEPKVANFFLIHQFYHLFWVLKRTVS